MWFALLAWQRVFHGCWVINKHVLKLESDNETRRFAVRNQKLPAGEENTNYDGSLFPREKQRRHLTSPRGEILLRVFFSLDSRQRPQSVSWPWFAWESPSHVITGRDASRESAAWKFAFSRQRPRGVTWKAIFTRMAEAAPSEQHCLVSNTHWRLTKKALWLN